MNTSKGLTVESVNSFIEKRNKDFTTPPARIAEKCGFNYADLGKPTEGKIDGKLSFTWKLPFGTLTQTKGKLFLTINKNQSKKMEAEVIESAPAAAAWAKDVPFESLKIEKGFNVRTEMGDLETLKRSIMAAGLLQPLTVRPSKKEGEYIIVSGHRRHEALRQLNEEQGNPFPEVGVIFEAEDTQDVDRIVSLLLDNDGKPLTILEQASVYQRLEKLGLSVKNIANKTGYTTEHIRNCMKLASAPEEIKQAVKDGTIKGTTAVRLVKSEKNPTKQIERLAEAKKKIAEKPASKVKGKSAAISGKEVVKVSATATPNGIKERIAEIQSGLVITSKTPKFSELRVWELLQYVSTGKLEKQFKSVAQMML